MRFACAFLSLVAACGGGSSTPDAGPVVPPEMCRAGGELGDGPWFTDVTEAWLGETVNGNRHMLADLDGDGRPELITHMITNARPQHDADPPVFTYRVLRNVGGERFEDVTLASGYGAARDGTMNRSANFASAGDYDNDGDLDLVSGIYADLDMAGVDVGDRNELFLNDGTGVFTRADSGALFDDEVPWHTTAAAPVDFDRDGNLDVFVGFWYLIYGSLTGMQDRLYRGNGEGRFSDRTDEAGLATSDGGFDDFTNHRPTYGVTACDVNDDGWPDLLAQAYGRQLNQLWLSDQGQYSDVGMSSGYAADENQDFSDNQFYRCYCVSNACDPDPPSPVIACQPGYWQPGFDDQIWRLGGNTFTTACGDVDNDGDLDLYNAEIKHWHIGNSSDESQLLVNDGAGNFTRPGVAASGLTVPHPTADWNEGGIMATFLDFDLDGNLDLYGAFSDYPGNWGILWRGNGDGTFTDVAAEAGVDHDCASGIAVGDLDGDGDHDLVIGSGTARDCATIWASNEVHIYRNDVGQEQNVLRLTLRGGDGSNGAAIGARITVTAGGKTLRRDVQGSFGHEAIGNDLEVLIATGADCTADVEVRWPDAQGTVETFAGVRANYRVVLTQGAGATYPGY